ncbi:acyl-CoA carboxylase subunit epsilon [Microbacterium sp. P04]|uniref:acyl-CoA carboxylase subunit epsilon n=1 Tax=Microbacterium sp. P04 TaxID=3366947 RepID=UPI0037474A4A
MIHNAAMDEAVPAPSVEVLRGDPTAAELAALIAVVGEAYLEESPADFAEIAPVRSRWDVTARGLRQPLARERGWGGFSG